MLVDLLGDKVEIAIELLQRWEPVKGYYLAFSGGKDSITVYDLCLKASVRFDAHYSVTTVDPPELVRFIKANYPDVIFSHPVKTMWKLIEEHHQPPLRTQRYCCEVLKETGGDGRFIVTGIRKAESVKRSKRKQIVLKAMK